MEKLGSIGHSLSLIIATVIGLFFGFLMGISFPELGHNISQFEFLPNISYYIEGKYSGPTSEMQNKANSLNISSISSNVRLNATCHHYNSLHQIYVPTNPRGAETLPPAIVEAETDLYLRRLWGEPSEDLPFKQKYLVTFTVGGGQKQFIDKAVKKFSDNFTILLFHYDNKTSDWDEFEWSKRAIHVSVRKQAKWWYVKRFLHPDIVAAYEYIFIWDEDLGVENFDAEEYIKVVKKHNLEISQPGLETKGYLSWRLTKRQPDKEIHKYVEERPGWCANLQVPPCAAFVEIMAPVFSRKAWRCVWYMIQNDLVHGWGLDLALRKCVDPAHEKIGIVDSQWVVHEVFPTLGDQGVAKDGKQPWQMVRERCSKEWGMFRNRMQSAVVKYYKDNNITPPNSTYS